MGSQDGVGHLLPWVWVTDGDCVVLQVPGGASVVEQKQNCCFLIRAVRCCAEPPSKNNTGPQKRGGVKG